MWRQTEDVRTRYIWRKILTYTTIALGIILVGHIWVEGFESLPTFLGLLSAGLAIALMDLVTNVAGWIFIAMQKPVTSGDRIEMGDNTGDVIDIRMFQFTVIEIGNWVDADQSTGRIIHIPNGRIFTETLANYSKWFLDLKRGCGPCNLRERLEKGKGDPDGYSKQRLRTSEQISREKNKGSK